MLSCQTGCCEACFILFWSCVSIPDFFIFVKMIIWRDLCRRFFLGYDLFLKKTDFIPTQISKSLWSIYILDFVSIFKHELVSWQLQGKTTVCSNSPSVHKYCLEIMQVQGPPTWTDIHTFTLQYLTLGGCIWHREAYYPPKFVDQNNNYLNVIRNLPTMKLLLLLLLLLKKTTLYCL